MLNNGASLEKKMHKKRDLPRKDDGEVTTTEPQKIVTSTTNPPVVTLPPIPEFVMSPPRAPSSLPQFIMQEDDTSTPTPDQLADNTRAKSLTWMLTQDFAQLALEQEIIQCQNKVGGKKIKFAGTMLDEKTGKWMYYQYLIKHPK